MYCLGRITGKLEGKNYYYYYYVMTINSRISKLWKMETERNSDI